MIRHVSAAESAGRYVPFRPYPRDFGSRKPAAAWKVQRDEKTKDDSGRGAYGGKLGGSGKGFAELWVKNKNLAGRIYFSKKECGRTETTGDIEYKMSIYRKIKGGRAC